MNIGYNEYLAFGYGGLPTADFVEYFKDGVIEPAGSNFNISQVHNHKQGGCNVRINSTHNFIGTANIQVKMYM